MVPVQHGTVELPRIYTLIMHSFISGSFTEPSQIHRMLSEFSVTVDRYACTKLCFKKEVVFKKM